MTKLKTKSQLGKTGLMVPPVIFGTSCLGNLYQALPDQTKLSIIKEWFEWVEAPVVIDTAGKYGAGLALETIGWGFKKLGMGRDDIIISNKLGWIRSPLTTPEPTFESGVWADLKNDAVQKISYEGIRQCYHQGLELLDGYPTHIVSVHDPDEYLAAAKDIPDRNKRIDDVLGAYQALNELKSAGEVKAVGIGAKDWHVIRELTEKIDLDWVMLAISLTIMQHPPDILDFIAGLENRGISVINSAVFHAGFLTGGNFFDYRKPDPSIPSDRVLFDWRDKFFSICRKHAVTPAEACVSFGLTPPSVISISLNTSKPERIRDNVNLVRAMIPEACWNEMKSTGLIDPDYPFVP
jgi:D-threo-aldose 1-dehydrogenase